MTPFQYVAPLTSIVIALGITRILTGLGRIVQMRGSVRTYRIHTLWTGNAFLWLLLNWWILSDGEITRVGPSSCFSSCCSAPSSPSRYRSCFFQNRWKSAAISNAASIRTATGSSLLQRSSHRSIPWIPSSKAQLISRLKDRSTS